MVWTRSRNTKSSKREESNPQEHDFLWKLMPNANESGIEYWRSVHSTSPLGVNYVVPQNSIKDTQQGKPIVRRIVNPVKRGTRKRSCRRENTSEDAEKQKKDKGKRTRQQTSSSSSMNTQEKAASYSSLSNDHGTSSWPNENPHDVMEDPDEEIRQEEEIRVERVDHGTPSQPDQGAKTNMNHETSESSVERTDSKYEEESSSSTLNEMEQRLQVGSFFDSLDAVYVLYCEYARLMGFSVKKGSQSYFINSLDIRTKAYHCSCEGHPDGKRYNDRFPSYRKQITRTNCKARLRVSRDELGPWTVSVFYDKHNHELLPDQSYLLHSARNLSHAKKSIGEALRDAGIGVSKAVRFTENEAGGVQNIGFTKKDAHDHLGNIRMKSNVPDRDLLELLSFFRKKQHMEPFFYWDYYVDDDGRLLNFFFRDTRSGTDYEYFGDVMSVDATYRTNKYNLFCVPFVGMNHHNRNVLFGLGFLSDESSESFNWLLKTFLESMYDKEPHIVITDQCKGLMNAVDTNFKTACHRLCQWHVKRNAAAKFNSMKLDDTISNLWECCMNGCESESEFDETWNHMVESYSLGDVGWFKNMHDLRRKWACVFTWDKFTAGMDSTSHSECTSKVLKDMYASSAGLHEFVMHYERIQSDWRSMESEEDALCRGRPGQFLHDNKLLTFAANIYTRSVFKIFEFEAAHTLNVCIMQHPPDINASTLIYKMKSSTATGRIHTVNLCRISTIATCTCCLFETRGFICRHILKLYFLLSIEKLPKDLILHRWTKDVKRRFGKDAIVAPKYGRPQFMSNLALLNRWMRLVYDKLYDCKDDYVYSICKQHLQQMLDEVSGKPKGDPPQANSSMLFDSVGCAFTERMLGK